MSNKNYGPTVKYFDWLGTKSRPFKAIHAILCVILMMFGLEIFIFNSNVLTRIILIHSVFGVFASLSYILAIILSATLGTAWFLFTLGSIIEHKKYVYLRIEASKRLGLDYSSYGHWSNEESKLWLRRRNLNLEDTQMSQCEERRRSRKKFSILRGIIHTILGFACILVWLLPPLSPPTIPRTELSYILSVCVCCAIGVLSCYWALKEFLDAYKERDALMGVVPIADFHIGHHSIRKDDALKRRIASKIPPDDTDCSL